MRFTAISLLLLAVVAVTLAAPSDSHTGSNDFLGGLLNGISHLLSNLFSIFQHIGKPHATSSSEAHTVKETPIVIPHDVSINEPAVPKITIPQISQPIINTNIPVPTVPKISIPQIKLPSVNNIPEPSVPKTIITQIDTPAIQTIPNIQLPAAPVISIPGFYVPAIPIQSGGPPAAPIQSSGPPAAPIVCVLSADKFPIADAAKIVKFFIAGASCALTNTINEFDAIITSADDYALAASQAALDSGIDTGLKQKVVAKYKEAVAKLNEVNDKLINTATVLMNVTIAKIKAIPSLSKEKSEEYIKAVETHFEECSTAIKQQLILNEVYVAKRILEGIMALLYGAHASNDDVKKAVQDIEKHSITSDHKIYEFLHKEGDKVIAEVKKH